MFCTNGIRLFTSTNEYFISFLFSIFLSGGKGGKNLHLFNSLRRDRSRSNDSISDAENDKPAEKPNPSTKTTTIDDTNLAASKNDTLPKSPQNSKTKKKVDRKDDRTLKQENRTFPAKEQLTNSLIYELDD